VCSLVPKALVVGMATYKVSEWKNELCRVCVL